MTSVSCTINRRPRRVPIVGDRGKRPPGDTPGRGHRFHFPFATTSYPELAAVASESMGTGTRFVSGTDPDFAEGRRIAF